MVDSVKNYLDGKKLIEWLEYNYPWIGEHERDNSTQKNIRKMRLGFPIDVYAVDRVLTKMGIPLTMVPEDIYVERSAAQSRSIPMDVRRAAAKRWASGENTYEIAREIDVAPDSVRNWASDLGLRKTNMSLNKELADRVTSKCRTCGTKITLLKSKADTGRGKHCSRECQKNSPKS